MHEGGIQTFEGDGLLTTPETTAHKQGTAIIPLEERMRRKRLFKNPIAPANGSSGEPSPLIPSVNAAASATQPRNPVWIRKGMSLAGVLTHPKGKLGGAHTAQARAAVYQLRKISNPVIVRSVFDAARATVPSRCCACRHEAVRHGSGVPFGSPSIRRY